MQYFCDCVRRRRMKARLLEFVAWQPLSRRAAAESHARIENADDEPIVAR